LCFANAELRPEDHLLEHGQQFQVRLLSDLEAALHPQFRYCRVQGETRSVPIGDNPLKYLQLPESEFQISGYEIVAKGQGGMDKMPVVSDVSDQSDAEFWNCKFDGMDPDPQRFPPVPSGPDIRNPVKVTVIFHKSWIIVQTCSTTELWSCLRDNFWIPNGSNHPCSSFTVRSDPK
jgi:hypothetical protein